MDERERIEKSSHWYLSEQIDFDKKLIFFRFLTLKPFLRGPYGLELGPAEGEMTRFLVNHFEKLIIVDASHDLLRCIPEYPNVIKIHSLFENYAPSCRFDSIIMEHVLEHVSDPLALLCRAKTWLGDGGRIIVGVPNGLSFHRLAAVKMGLLEDPCQLNTRDILLGHRRVFTPDTLRGLLLSTGLHLIDMGGVFFKPLSNQQIQEQWSEAMIQGFYELGKDFPSHAAELYAVCELL